MWMCWGWIAQTGAADGSYYATFKASIVDSCEMTIATGISINDLTVREICSSILLATIQRPH